MADVVKTMIDKIVEKNLFILEFCFFNFAAKLRQKVFSILPQNFQKL